MSIIPSVAIDTVNIEHTNGKSFGDDVNWWPMFRHDLQHTGYSTSKAPDTNNVLWNYSIGNASRQFSNPVVAYGRVYIGSSDSRNKNVYCLDACNGEYIWSYKTGALVQSTAAVANGKVYVASNDCNVYCLDAITGRYIWSFWIGEWIYSSPAVVDGKVYIGSYYYHADYNVYCLDANTGDLIWNYTTGANVWSSPAVANGKVYIGSMDCNVYCLDATTGEYIWSYPTMGGVYYSPAVANGNVYVGSYDDNLYCLDAINGSCIWSYTTEGVSSSPAVADGKVYFGSYDDKVYCLDANTGNYIWSYKTRFWVDSSPAVADGKVYVGSNDNNFYCLNANTGAHIWNYTTGDDVFSSPAVADGKVYVASDDFNVYAFGILEPNAPTVPEIVGPKKCRPDVLYNFTFKSESPLGRDLFYWIEWADGSNSGWLGPFDSGVEITESHSWDTVGKYPIQARTKDINGLVSCWGVLEVTVPRNRAKSYLWYQWFLERFPLLERLLSLIRIC